MAPSYPPRGGVIRSKNGFCSPVEPEVRKIRLLTRALPWAYAQEPTSRVPVSHDQQRSNTMSRGFPSMTALLGLLAVAGYQNRDKIAEILGGIGQSKPRRHRAEWHRRLARPAEQEPRRCQCRWDPERWTRRTRGALQAERPWRNCGVPGSERAPTNQSPRPNSNRRSAPRC